MSEKHEDAYDKVDSEENMFKTRYTRKIPVSERKSDPSFGDNLTAGESNWKSQTAFKFDMEVPGETTVRFYKIGQININTLLYKTLETETLARSTALNKLEVKSDARDVKSELRETEVESTKIDKAKLESIALENLKKIIRSSVGLNNQTSPDDIEKSCKIGVKQEKISSFFNLDPKIAKSLAELDFSTVQKERSLGFQKESACLAEEFTQRHFAASLSECSTVQNSSDLRTEICASKEAQNEKGLLKYQATVHSSKIKVESGSRDEQSSPVVKGCFNKSESHTHSEDLVESSVPKIISDYRSESESEKCPSDTSLNGVQPSDDLSQYSFRDASVENVLDIHADEKLYYSQNEVHFQGDQTADASHTRTQETLPESSAAEIPETCTTERVLDTSVEDHFQGCKTEESSDIQTEDDFTNIQSVKVLDTHNEEQTLDISGASNFPGSQSEKASDTEIEDNFTKAKCIEVPCSYIEEEMSGAIAERHFLDTQTEEYSEIQTVGCFQHTLTAEVVPDTSIEDHFRGTQIGEVLDMRAEDASDIQIEEASGIQTEDHFTNVPPTEVSDTYNESEMLDDSIQRNFPGTQTTKALDIQTGDKFTKPSSILDYHTEGEMSNASVEHFSAEEYLEIRTVCVGYFQDTSAAEVSETGTAGSELDAADEDNFRGAQTEKGSDIQHEGDSDIQNEDYLTNISSPEISDTHNEEQTSDASGESHFPDAQVEALGTEIEDNFTKTTYVEVPDRHTEDEMSNESAKEHFLDYKTEESGEIQIVSCFSDALAVQPSETSAAERTPDTSVEGYFPHTQIEKASDTQIEDNFINIPSKEKRDSVPHTERHVSDAVCGCNFREIQTGEALDIQTEDNFTKISSPVISDSQTKEKMSDASAEGHLSDTETTEASSEIQTVSSFSDNVAIEVSEARTVGCVPDTSVEDYFPGTETEGASDIQTGIHFTNVPSAEVADTHNEEKTLDAPGGSDVPDTKYEEVSDTQIEDNLTKTTYVQVTDWHTKVEMSNASDEERFPDNQTIGHLPDTLAAEVSETLTTESAPDTSVLDCIPNTQTEESLDIQIEDNFTNIPSEEVLVTHIQGQMSDASSGSHFPDTQIEKVSNILTDDNFTTLPSLEVSDDHTEGEMSDSLAEEHFLHTQTAKCSDIQTVLCFPDTSSAEVSETLRAESVPDISVGDNLPGTPIEAALDIQAEEASYTEIEDHFPNIPSTEVSDTYNEEQMSNASSGSNFPDIQTEDNLTKYPFLEVSDSHIEGEMPDASSEGHLLDFQTEESSQIQIICRFADTLATRILEILKAGLKYKSSTEDHFLGTQIKETADIQTEDHFTNIQSAELSDTPTEVRLLNVAAVCEEHLVDIETEKRLGGTPTREAACISTERSLLDTTSEVYLRETQEPSDFQFEERLPDVPTADRFPNIQTEEASNIQTEEVLVPHAPAEEASQFPDASDPSQASIEDVHADSQTQNYLTEEILYKKTELQIDRSKTYNVQQLCPKLLTYEITEIQTESSEVQTKILKTEANIVEIQDENGYIKKEIQESSSGMLAYIPNIQANFFGAYTGELTSDVKGKKPKVQGRRYIPEAQSEICTKTEIQECLSEVSTESEKAKLFEVPSEERISEASANQCFSEVQILDCLSSVVTEMTKVQPDVLETQRTELSEVSKEIFEIQGDKVKSKRNSSKTKFRQRTAEVYAELHENKQTETQTEKLGVEIQNAGSKSKALKLEVSSDGGAPVRKTKYLLEGQDYKHPLPSTPKIQAGKESYVKNRSERLDLKELRNKSWSPSEEIHFSDVSSERPRLSCRTSPQASDNVTKMEHSGSNERTSPAFVAGDRICEFSPFVYVLNNAQISIRCSYCFKSFATSKKEKCNSCSGAYYCDTECKNRHSHTHSKECVYLKKCHRRRFFPGRFSRLAAQAMWKLQDPWSKKSCCTIGNKTYYYQDLPSYNCDLGTKPGVKFHLKEAYNALRTYINDASISLEEFIDLYRKISRHMMNIIEAPGKNIGAAMYFGMAAIEHSCRPNANVTFIGTKAQIVACRDIEVADLRSVTLRLVPLTMITAERHSSLEFIARRPCNCELCQSGETDEILNEVKGGEITKAIMMSVEETLEHVEKNMDEFEGPEDVVTIACEALAAMEGVAGRFNCLRGRMLELASVHSVKMENHENVITYLKELLLIYRYVFGDNHPAIVNTLLKLSVSSGKTGNPGAARDYLRQAVEAAYNTYSFRHPFFKSIRYQFIQQEERNWENTDLHLEIMEAPTEDYTL